ILCNQDLNSSWKCEETSQIENSGRESHSQPLITSLGAEKQIHPRPSVHKRIEQPGFLQLQSQTGGTMLSLRGQEGSKESNLRTKGEVFIGAVSAANSDGPSMRANFNLFSLVLTVRFRSDDSEGWKCSKINLIRGLPDWTPALSLLTPFVQTIGFLTAVPSPVAMRIFAEGQEAREVHKRSNFAPEVGLGY
ncbi:hypothetical protein MUK42_10931, partial [Musa troglodytarum]